MGTRALERGVIIGTAGHIDHGKTALVRSLTGVDTDRLPEEKRRGITIDLGFAPLSLDGIGQVGVVDVPGHEDFVRSMLVGASGIDVALLVVAADEGVMPQTREHLLILELLRIPRVVVAITKSDLVDEEWLTLVRQDVIALFDASPLDPPAVVACSAKTGAGLDSLRAALTESLLSLSARPDDDLFRMPVDRAFSVKGTGTVVTGTIWSGAITTDQTLRILPGNKTARVRRIEQHGKATQRARPGTRTAIALAGLELSEVARGSVIVTHDSWRPTRAVEASIFLSSRAPSTIGSRTRLRLHAGASETGCRLSTRGDELTPRRSGQVRVVFESPVVLRGGDRFVLRLPAPLGTVGGGVVIDPFARAKGYGKTRGSFVLSEDPRERLRFALESEGVDGVSLDDIPVRAGCSPRDVANLIISVNAVQGHHNLFTRGAVEQVMASVQRIIAEYEIKAPLSPGVPTRTLREALRANEELADISIRELEKAREIETRGPLMCRTGWSPSPKPDDIEASNHLAHDICAGEREPPSVTELVSRYGSSVPGLLSFLERQGRIVRVETDRYYDREALDDMIARLKGTLKPGQVYAPGQLREILGSSRKYLIPFLEFCDRNGLTERTGEGRILKETSGVLLDTPQPTP
ncbi:MAG: selenocysteine-specific translation elongation factor [Gemmatimonadaceae bacterium]